MLVSVKQLGCRFSKFNAPPESLCIPRADECVMCTCWKPAKRDNELRDMFDKTLDKYLNSTCPICQKDVPWRDYYSELPDALVDDVELFNMTEKEVAW